ncbi:MAG: DUF3305 domain-containing protein [Rhizobiales bacterium]|nr:DUF3305 domain-containing protein [Hyphomicrobiales bacterium]
MRQGLALASFSVGVVVERVKAKSPWIDYVWRPVAVLQGVPETPTWTVLKSEGDTTTFYGGAAEVVLYRSETANYRDNLATGAPLLWVVLRPTESEPPYSIAAVTADPAEGEAFTEAGNDLVDSVPMPDEIVRAIADFVAEHHVERTYTKRKRDRADPQSLARRGPVRESGDE